MTVVWDKEIKAFVHLETGRVLAPRLDEDGIDLFFVENRNDKKARARYCTGEGYWAFPWSEEEINKVLEDYKELLEHLEKYGKDDVKKLLEE
jgi:hypothetical protein